MSVHKYQSTKGVTYFVKVYLGLNDYGKKNIILNEDSRRAKLPKLMKLLLIIS